MNKNKGILSITTALIIIGVLVVGSAIAVFIITLVERPEDVIKEDIVEEEKEEETDKVIGGTIIISQEGRKLKISVENERFQELKQEMERLTTNVDTAYDLEIDSLEFLQEKNKVLSVELIYSSPLQKKGTLSLPGAIESIFIPLKSNFFPSDSVLVFQNEEPSLNVLANTKETKDKLIEIVKDFGFEQMSLETKSLRPSIGIISPTNRDGYTTKNNIIDITGIAMRSDEIRWHNDRGGEGTAVGTRNWGISEITLQPGDNVITVTATNELGLTDVDGIIITYNPNLEFLENQPFRADPDSAWVSESTSIIFRISIEDNPKLDETSVRVVQVDENNNILKTITYLADDGNLETGDRQAQDGIFSGKAVFNEDEEHIIRVRVVADTIENAKIETAYSEVVDIHVFTPLTREQSEISTVITIEAEEKYEEFKEIYGTEIAIGKTVEWLINQPNIIEVGWNFSSIFFTFDSGISGGILIYDKDIYSVL